MGWRDSLRNSAIQPPTVIALGTFDGVHVGHQHLIRQVVHHAHRLQASAVALTFDPRPSEVLRPDRPSLYLCSVEERGRRLRQAGADSVLVVPFTRELSQVGATEFVSELVRTLGMRTLVGGPDLAVGRGREGTPLFLREVGQQLGFCVDVVDGFEQDGRVVRTRAVRAALAEGDVDKAAHLLGRAYSVEGTVVPGDGRGRTIGVPTANVATAENLFLPENGVYAVRFHVDGELWNGAANIGVRPTFNGVGRSLEVHLLDYDGDLYGRQCVVQFAQRLRPEQRFPGIDDLVRQIRQDIASARDILARG
jgi:riboflavin kinase/FMN adenylyltransferase